MSDYARPVAKGAALYDRLLPGWPRNIDPDQLDMGSGFWCTAGQLARHDLTQLPGCHPDYWYASAVADLGLSLDGAREHGFQIAFDPSRPIEDDEAEFTALGAEWKRQILARRMGVAA
jgi:hypothetical protein